nr:MAG TPA_asm: hypothetical protein [Caudoviricetes sp.]
MPQRWLIKVCKKSIRNALQKNVALSSNEFLNTKSINIQDY